MKLSTRFLGAIAAVALTSTASAAGLKIGETANCKLTNVTKDVALYDGECQVTEEITNTSTIFTVKMGSAESFMFASADGKHWMHGPEEVEFTDLGQGAIFKWSDFALAIAE
jgi:hypothetical protein